MKSRLCVGYHIVVDQQWPPTQFNKDSIASVPHGQISGDPGLAINVVQPDAMRVVVLDEVSRDQATHKVMHLDAANLRCRMTIPVVAFDYIADDLRVQASHSRDSAAAIVGDEVCANNVVSRLSRSGLTSF